MTLDAVSLIFGFLMFCFGVFGTLEYQEISKIIRAWRKK